MKNRNFILTAALIVSFAGLVLYSNAMGGAEHSKQWNTVRKPKQMLDLADKNNTDYILVKFTGSDWCPPCIQLQKNVLSKTPFKNYAKENLLLVLVDFPKRKQISQKQIEANYGLREHYKANKGLPTLILLNRKGEVLKRWLGYFTNSPQDFIENIERVIAEKNS